MANQRNDFRFTVSPEASVSIHDEGIVILHLGSGSIYTSNETGAGIWRRVERQLPLEAIAEEISAEYQIPQSTSREQIIHFLAELERCTLVSREALA